LWEAATGKLLQKLQDADWPKARLRAVAFNAQTDVLAAVVRDEPFWDYKSGEPRKEPRTFLCLWHLADGKLQRRIDLGADKAPEALAFTADGKHLISSGPTTTTWDAASGARVSECPNDIKHLHCLGIVPGDKIAFGVSHEYDTLTLHRWEVASGKLVERQVLRNACSCAVAADGNTIAYLANPVSEDGTLHLYDVRKKTVVHRFPMNWRIGGEWPQVAFSADGQALACATGHTLRLWDVADRKEVLPDADRHRDNTTPQFSPDDRTVATLRDGKLVCLWDVSTGRNLRAFEHDEGVYTLTFSPDGTLLATGGYGVCLWDIATGQKLFGFKPEIYNVIGNIQQSCDRLAFSADGAWLAAADSNEVYLWDIARRKQVRHLRLREKQPFDGGENEKGMLLNIRFSGDGKKLVLVSSKEVQVWDLAAAEPKRPLVFAKPMEDVALAPDGKTLLTADGTVVERWDLTLGRSLGALMDRKEPDREDFSGLPNAPEESPLKIGLSVDGRTVALHKPYHDIRVWDLTTGRFCFLTQDHDWLVFAPDGKTAFASSDGSTWIYEMATGQQRLRFRHTLLGVSHRGDKIITQGAGNSLLIWDVTQLGSGADK
jgi:WD40 repeat protein